jgi:hypothetical protein
MAAWTGKASSRAVGVDELDEEDIPELEDMTEELKKIQMVPQQTKESSQKIAEDYTKTVEEIKSKESKDREEFDKKLAQSLLKSGPAHAQAKLSESKPVTPKNPLEFKEVQENMQKGNLGAYVEQTKNQWMTPDLLNAIQSNPHLMQSLADPEISQAIALMQMKPEEAKKKYEKNEKVTRFMVEFSKLMGSHFEKLAPTNEPKKEAGPTPLLKEMSSKQLTQSSAKPGVSGGAGSSKPTVSTTDPVLARKLEEPAIKAILSDKRVAAFLEHLQKGNPVDFFQLARSDPELAYKLRVLIDRGILNTHAQPPK